MMISAKHNGFGHNIHVQLPRVKQPVPLFIVFRALGIIPDKDICSKIVLNLEEQKYKDIINGLQGSIIDANSIMTKEDAINYIMNNVMFTPINMDKEAGMKKKLDFTMDYFK